MVARIASMRPAFSPVKYARGLQPLRGAPASLYSRWKNPGRGASALSSARAAS